MPEKAFDSRKFINCTSEQEQFEELLSFKTPARILTVRDATGGKGKSQLLEKFKHRCRTGKPLTPVSLVALDQLEDHSPQTLLKVIARQLSQLDLKDYRAFAQVADLGSVGLINATVSADSSRYDNVGNIRQGGVVAERIENMVISPANPSALTPGQMNVVGEKTFEGFLSDMRANCARRPAVVMLDGFEKSKPDIRSWVLDWLLERHFFNRELSACRWALVIAGREVPDFEERWPKEDCDELVMRIEGLSKWTRANVEQCMRARGFGEPEPNEVDFFFKMVQYDMTPLIVVQAMDSMLESRRRKVA